MTTTRVAPSPSPPHAEDSFGPPPRPRAGRSLTGAVAGSLLVVFCAAAVAAYTARLGHRQTVLVITRAVSAGATISNADLGEVRLSVDPALHPVAASQRSRMVGRVTSVNLAPGTLLAASELVIGPQADRDHAIVGLALKAGQYPTGLRSSDRVLLVDTGPGTSTDSAALESSVLVDNAQVTATAVAGDGQTTIVSVLVPRTSAAVVVAAAARSRVSVVLLGGLPHP